MPRATGLRAADRHDAAQGLSDGTRGTLPSSQATGAAAQMRSRDGRSRIRRPQRCRSPQHIVILGGTGFVGADLVRARAEGHTITVFSARPSARNIVSSACCRGCPSSKPMLNGDVLRRHPQRRAVGDQPRRHSTNAAATAAFSQSACRAHRTFDCRLSRRTRAAPVADERAARRRRRESLSAHARRSRGIVKSRAWLLRRSFAPGDLYPGDGLFVASRKSAAHDTGVAIARAEAVTPVYVGDVAHSRARSRSGTPPAIGTNCSTARHHTARTRVRRTAELIGQRGAGSSQQFDFRRLSASAVGEWVAGQADLARQFPLTQDRFGRLEMASLGIVATPMDVIIVPALLRGDDWQRRLDRYRMLHWHRKKFRFFCFYCIRVAALSFWRTLDHLPSPAEAGIHFDFCRFPFSSNT